MKCWNQTLGPGDEDKTHTPSKITYNSFFFIIILNSAFNRQQQTKPFLRRRKEETLKGNRLKREPKVFWVTGQIYNPYWILEKKSKDKPHQVCRKDVQYKLGV